MLLSQRTADAEHYLLNLVESSLAEYGKGEWLGVVRNRLRDLAETAM